MPFDPGQSRAAAIPFAFADYTQLVASVGRVVRSGKRGSLPETTPAILQRLQIDPAQFIRYANGLFQEFAPPGRHSRQTETGCVQRQLKSLRPGCGCG